MSPIIELTLGILLVFVVLSLIASGVQEVVASILSLRAELAGFAEEAARSGGETSAAV